LVGMSCALALNQIGFTVALIESKAAHIQEPQDAWDSRIYAITPANVQWLSELGAWQRVDAQRVCAIEKMRIFGDAEDSELIFDANEANVDCLGVIAESGQIEKALLKAIEHTEIQILAGVMPTKLSFAENQAWLDCNEQEISADLLVAADGAKSWLRSEAGIAIAEHDFQQMGVVANFELEQSHQHTAYQWFSRRGVLAWLPLAGNRMSMVWSTDTATAADLKSMSAEALCAEVAQQGNSVLGKFTLITAPQAFPLREQTAQCLVLPNLALVGDAAHTIHPLAGQGVNLGFRDVQSLVETLAKKHQQQSCGDIMLLRRYERARKTDMMAMKSVTRGLSELFSLEYPAVQKLRNWGLSLTNQQTFLKKSLMQHAIK
jgi:2-octaprenylphenol hydroxylase